jgi:hypothetical protein
MGLKERQRAAGRARSGRALAALAVVVGAVSVGAGCASKDPVEPPCDQDIKPYEAFTAHTTELKLDLLFTIDNSRSMADKQALLALAIPDLVAGLVNPPCVDENGTPSAAQPAGPLDLCPVAGTRREQAPILDIHIGVISSSLGGHGSDACPNKDVASCAPATNLSNNDKGHLLTRKDPCSGEAVPSYQSKGFLAWDPAGRLDPAGEKDSGAFSSALRDMVTGAGQIGCGFEAQLESWYRFLVDPEPYASISVVNGKAVLEGIDEILLAQRADFLRPDSILMITLLSDENDCSVKEGGSFFYSQQIKDELGMPFHLPRARSECASDPNDPCCKSCGQDPGNCPVDPTCFDQDGAVLALTEPEDMTNLRCFDQKRRFGIDFLHPTERYSAALTSLTVPNRAGELVPNPLYSDLNPSDSTFDIRFEGQVFLVGIVGVPWQDIARDPTDLAKGFKNADELLIEDASGENTWDIILGQPGEYVPPKDPHMIESLDPRSGTNPVTGDVLGPPGSQGASSINGGEWTVKNRDDLQYACAFPLAEPRDCGDASITSCDCKDPSNDNPLCAEDPKDPGSRTIQVKAKAYPGLRELEVLRDVGSQGITASICPANVASPDALDFAYRPVVGAMLERLRAFTSSWFPCMKQTLPRDEGGRLTCRLIEARSVPESSCACDASKGRSSMQPEDSGLVKTIELDPNEEKYGLNCFCELDQLANVDGEGNATGELDACQQSAPGFPTDASGEIISGWCYVDATTTPATGNPEIVAECPETAKRTIRFVGNGAPTGGARLFLTCSDACQ